MFLYAHTFVYTHQHKRTHARIHNMQVQKHLRLLITAATNDLPQWCARCVKFPLVLSCTSIFWLGTRPSENMQNFGMQYLSAMIDGEEQVKRPDIVAQVSRHLTLVHQAAADFLSRPHHYSDSPSVLSCYPPASFAWYAQTWASIYKRRKEEATVRNERTRVAAEKLEAALVRLNDLDASIEDQRQLVEQKKLVANRLLTNVGQETALLNEQKVLLQDDEKIERASAAQVEAVRLELAKHLERVTPYNEKITSAFEHVDPHLLNEVRGATVPVESVVTTLRAISVLLTVKGKHLPGQDALTWKELKKLLGKPDVFITMLTRCVYVYVCMCVCVCGMHLLRNRCRTKCS